MKIPDHLRPPLLEQLEDQEDSDDCLILRGSALGHALLENDDKRDYFIRKFIESDEPSLGGNELGRELQARGVGKILLKEDAEKYLSRAKEFEILFSLFANKKVNLVSCLFAFILFC